MTKKCLSMLAMLLLAVACIFALSGCGGEEISQIVVKNSDSPRLTYVVGQELDLAKGVLTVVIDGKENAIPLNAEGVTVTGYDKDTIGEQTLTITYKENVTYIKVTVVPRMTAENYENKYFVGDAFDSSKGRLKIVRDDGTSFAVPMNDPGVSIKSFDSSVVGQRPVCVSYTGSEGTYETEFTVNVYGIGAVSFTKPTKSAYQSHETELSVAGGYFTVTADGAPDLKKYVNITPDMAAGFDPTVATMDKNRKDPVLQTVTYTYAGQQFEQEITITFSGVSVVIERAAQLKNVDWSGETLNLTEAEKEAVMDAATELVALTKAKRVYIPDEDIETVVRVAAFYIMECFMDELGTYSHTIALDDAGYFRLVAESYDYMVADYKRLGDPDSKLNLYISILSELKEDFGDIELKYFVTVGQFIAVPSDEDLLSFTNVFEYMIELHDRLSVVPNDWTVESLADHGNAIDSVVSRIKRSGYPADAYTDIYHALSAWREKDDYFKIIYTYYFYTVKGMKDYVLTDLWQKVTLPGKLEEWYECICSANYEAKMMEEKGAEAYLYDTTNFMFFYWKALALAEEIRNDDDPLCRELYDFINCDIVLNLNVVYEKYGYYYHMSAMVDSPRVVALWESYMELYDLAVRGVEIPDERVKRVLDDFSALSTADVLGFLYSLHFGYSSDATNAKVLDCSASAMSKFTFLLGNYYMSQMSENSRPAFIKMLNAIECYALSGVAAGAEEDFKKTMGELNALYSTFSQDEKNVFDGIFGECYSKYQTIYKTLSGEQTPTLSDEESAKLEQLKTLLLHYDELMAYLLNESTSEEAQKTAFVLVFAIYERAHEIYEDILSTGSKELLNQLYTTTLMIEGTPMSMETTYFFCRNSFASYLFSASVKLPQGDGTVASQMACEVYLSDASDIRAFLADAYEIIWKQFKGETPTLETAMAVIESFTKLSDVDKVLFYYLGIDYYYDGILIALTGALPESCDSLALGLLEAELIYVNSTRAANQAEVKKMFKDRMDEVIAAYGQVPEEDMEVRDTYLGKLYSYYKAIYDAMT